MSTALRLAFKSLRHYWGRTLITVLALSLTLSLPFALQGLLETLGRELLERADRTPYVVGKKGSRYDLVLHSLMFRGKLGEHLSMAEFEQIHATRLAQAIPLFLNHTARDVPLVATTPDYFEFRGLVPREGHAPAFVGELALGSAAAARLDLRVGDSILSDQSDLYDIARSYPLKMQVVGVFAATGTVDDDAGFVDLKTGWMMEGIGHGHDPAAEADDSKLLMKEEDAVVLDSSVFEFNEVNAANRDRIHFHASNPKLPVSAILIIPKDAKSATFLRGTDRLPEPAQMLRPREVMDEMLGFLLRLKQFFDAHTAMVLLATTLLIATVIGLSLQSRQREFSTLAKIGVARSFVLQMAVAEVTIQLGLGLAGALTMAAGTYWLLVTKWGILSGL